MVGRSNFILDLHIHFIHANLSASSSQPPPTTSTASTSRVQLSTDSSESVEPQAELEGDSRLPSYEEDVLEASEQRLLENQSFGFHVDSLFRTLGIDFRHQAHLFGAEATGSPHHWRTIVAGIDEIGPAYAAVIVQAMQRDISERRLLYEV